MPKTAWERLPIDFEGPAEPSASPVVAEPPSQTDAETLQKEIDRLCEHHTLLNYQAQVTGRLIAAVATAITEALGVPVVVLAVPRPNGGFMLAGYALPVPTVHRVRTSP